MKPDPSPPKAAAKPKTKRSVVPKALPFKVGLSKGLAMGAVKSYVTEKVHKKERLPTDLSFVKGKAKQGSINRKIVVRRRKKSECSTPKSQCTSNADR